MPKESEGFNSEGLNQDEAPLPETHLTRQIFKLQQDAALQESASYFIANHETLSDAPGVILNRLLRNRMNEASQQQQFQKVYLSSAFAKAYQGTYQQNRERPSESGFYLNNLDSEISAGVEQYLPTATTRLKVIKERLLAEKDNIQALMEKLRQFQTASPDIGKQIEALEQKYQAILSHEEKVDFQLSCLCQDQLWLATLLGSVERFSQWVQAQQQRLFGKSLWSACLRKTRPEHYQLISLNQSLHSLSDIVHEQDAAGHRHPIQLDGLVNEYEHLLLELDQVMASLNAKRSLWQKLEQGLQWGYLKLFHE